MRRWLIIGIALLLSLTLVAGCAPAPAPSPAPAPAPAPAPSPAPAPAPAPVNPEADFYKGKTLTLIASTRPGSGTDTLARVVAPWLQKELGCTVVVDNMPAVGSLEGVNYTYNKANPRGLTICTVAGGAMVPMGVLELRGAEYELTKFSFVGTIGDPFVYPVFVQPGGPYDTIEKLRAGKNLRFASPTLASVLSQGCATAIECLGLDAKLVTGLKGTKPIYAARRSSKFGPHKGRVVFMHNTT